MASNLGTMYVNILANTQQFQRQLREMSRTLEATGKKLKDVGKTMTAALTLPLGAAGLKILKTGSDFEYTMKKVQAVSSSSGEDMLSLAEKAKEMGKATKFSASQSAEALNFMALAGWDTTQMIEGLDGVLNLAAASGEDLAIVADIVTDAMTGLKLETKESTRFADILAATFTNTNTDIAMLGEAFKYVAPLAGAMGVTAEETALALGMMAANGVKASMAGTSLRAVFSRLTTNESTVKMLKKLNVETVRNDGSMRDFKDILIDLRGVFKVLTEEEKTMVAETVAGRFAMSGFLAMVEGSDKDFIKLSNAIDTSAGKAKEISDIMMDSFVGRMQEFRSAIEGVMIQLFERMLPLLTDLVDNKLKPAVKWFGGLSEKTQKIILVFGGLTAVVGPLLIIAGALITAISTLGAVFAAVSAPVWIITGAVIGFIAAMVALYNTSEEFKVAADATWSYLSVELPKHIDVISSKISELDDKMYEAALGGLSKLMEKSKGFISWVRSNKFLQKALGVPEHLREDPDFLAGNVPGATDEGVKKAVEKYKDGKKRMKEEQKSFINETKKTFKKIMPDLLNIKFLEELYEKYREAGLDAINDISDSTKKYIDLLKEQIKTFKEAFGVFEKPMLEKISGERLLVRMEAQTKIFEKWQKALEVLKSKLGESSQLFQRLREEGPRAAGQLIGLAGLSPEQLAKAERLYAGRADIATNVGTQVASSQMRNNNVTVNLNGGVHVGDMRELANMISREIKLAGVN